MIMVTIETADNALKSFYLDAITETLNFKVNPFLAKIEQSSESVVGKDVRKFIRTGINGGISAGSETGDLPTSASRDGYQFVATLKNLYGTIEISDKALRASANNEGAFVNILNDEMQSLVKSAKLNFGRMLYGDGTGHLATVTNQGENNQIAVVSSVEKFVEGMRVDFVDPNNQFVDDLVGLKVVKVDRTKNAIYFEGVPTDMTIPTASRLFAHGARGYEITGLGAIFGQNKLYGVDRSKAFMQPYSTEITTSITEEILQKALDCIEEKSGNRPNFIVCSWGVRRALIQFYTSRALSLPTTEIEGGVSAISFNGIPVVADRFCPKGTMYLLNTNDFKLHQLCDWKWLEGEDGKILKQVPGKPVYTATLVKYAELMCSNPSGQGVIKGIVEK
jgi:hypothetical protein